RAPPDGYTLLMVSTNLTIGATFYDNLNYNLVRDIAPVASISRETPIMLVHPSVPAKTVPEFIAYAKAHPGDVNMASAGTGSCPLSAISCPATKRARYSASERPGTRPLRSLIGSTGRLTPRSSIPQ